MARESAFGAEPQQLRELLSYGLEDSSEQPGALTPSFSAVLEHPGGHIGRYKLLRVLGEGGMGIAFLAEQQEPIKRQVALKVIKPGMDSKRVIARFEAERQTLALLDHTNIAHIHEAGTTDSGRPYFAMEYVEGLPITEHCDRHKLPIEDRLHLFQQVCQAVHHAHQKGIIHRDIKPSNILVSVENDKAIPKIIDFGIAKAIAKSSIEQALFTQDDQLLGTPEYMSPEQADLAAEDIDTRSDIYSLGVLLYVLLTGVMPFDSETLREGGIEHIRKVIREEEPKTPCVRLTGLGEEARTIAQRRQTDVSVLTRRLRRELEWIPLKAMRKERTRRYRSASEFADDIERYLNGVPLIAGPESVAYRLQKFVRRNRVFVAGIAALLTVLVVGVIISTSFALRAQRARDEAQTVSDFLLESALRSLNPWGVRSKEMTARSILDEISQELEDKFQDQPLYEASIRATLASAYGVWGVFDLAELHAKRALEIRQTHLGGDNIATLDSLFQLGWVYVLQTRCNEAESRLTEALAGFELALDEGDSRRVYCIAFRGWVHFYRGHFPKAEKLFTGALDAAESVRDAGDPQVLYLLYSLGMAQQFQGRYEKAEELYVRGLDISGRVPGERGDATLMLMHGLGSLRWAQGRYDEAEALLDETLAHRFEAWGKEHPRTLITMADLGLVYYSQGRYEEAEDLFRRALKIQERVVGREHLHTALSMDGLGALFLSQGRYDEAETFLTNASDILYTTLGGKSWATLRLTNTLARLYTAKGDYDQAELLLQEVLEARRGVLGEDHPDTLESKNDLAVLYKEQERYEEAEPLLLEALEGRRLKLSDTHPHTLESWNILIQLYEAWSKQEKADEWRAKLPQMETVEQ